MTQRYVIIGNGPAGATAAETIRRLDSAADVEIVGDEGVPFYSRPGLAYLLNGTVPEKLLFSRSDREYASLGVRRTVGRVSRIEPTHHRVVVADGRTLAYDRLLIAVGARALRPDLPGIDLDGVVTLDKLEDARRIIRLARSARQACVVGGGITALELAEGLAARRVETHYLMRGERYWASVLDPRESELVEGRLAEEDIQVHRGVEVRAVIGHRGRVAAVELQDGSILPCELLAVAVGIQPRVELAREAGLETGRGVWTDPMLQTSDPDVFAAGDVAEVLDPVTGRRVCDSLWSSANDQGRAAGASLCGAGTPYQRPAPLNVTRIGGITTTLIGSIGGGGREDDLVSLARGDSGAWRERLDAFAVVADSGADQLRLLLGTDRITGAVVMGDQTLSRPLQHLIRERVDISAVRDRLAEHPGDLGKLVDTLGPGLGAR
ncbi:MAG: NAD(P)/FAD-dependent oxidoreductase [Chloroflexi bacterium]|nr:NAD(P)/FAD-dependent oxidoreductase [Chloroflexota bacterium]